MLAFGPADIARVIEPATLARGRALHANAQVIDVKIDEDGAVICGRVQGSEPEPYEQWISLRPGKSRIIIHGTCSCPVHSNCKHVAAVLIEVERRTLPLAAAPTLVAPGKPDDGPRSRGLSPQLQLWLNDLAEVSAPGSADNAYPADIKQRLIYVLEVEPGRNGYPSRACINPKVAALRKSGDFGSARPYSPSNIFNYQPAKHLRRVDHEILGELDWLMRRTAGSTIGGVPVSANPMFARVMTVMLGTARCRWGQVNGPVLNVGPARRATLRWRLGTGARQSLVIELEAETAKGDEAFKIDAVLATSPPFYVDLAACLAGPLDLGLPDAVAARVAATPAVTSAEAAAFTVALGRRLASSGLEDRIPLPMPPQKTDVRAIPPQPRLELLIAPVRLKPQYAWYVTEQRQRGTFQLPLARLSFDYAGEVVPIHATGETLERMEGDTLVVMPRDSRAEIAAFERLGKLGLKGLKDSLIQTGSEHAKDLLIAPGGSNPYEALAQIDDPSRFIAFSADIVPLLRSEGWQVVYADDYPYKVAEGEVGWWAGIGEGSGIDWFSFELGIEFEGQRINLAPQLASMLSKLPAEVGELALSPDSQAADDLVKHCRRLKLYHTLPDGRLLLLPGERLAPILKGLIELIGPRADAIENGKVKLHRAEAGALAALAEGLGTDVAWAASAERLVALGRDLRRGRGLKDSVPPATFRAELRPYQAIGLSWLDFLRETGFGGVLADDMGLGKTVQALAFIACEKAQGRLDRPALIVAPTSVLPNWQAEVERFAPSLDVLALRGLDRKQLFGGIARHDLVLTTYPLLMRDHGVLLGYEFHVAVLDEAQAIKNPHATVSGLAHRIKARHRLALTGTPLENNLGEVWSLFEF
ncbi:MAG: SNF2-related protein, partial [Hyphomicrobiaceae bacterium]